MILEGAPQREILTVCRSLRAKSAAEMFLFRESEDRDALARDIAGLPGMKWCAHHLRRPAAIIGAYPQHPGVWGMFGFGTDDYDAVMVEVTKFGRAVVMPAVKAAGAHRIECYSPAGHDDTHRWLAFFGLQREATLRAYGKGGEDVFVFAWVKDRDDVR